jgi:hypothetical protein
MKEVRIFAILLSLVGWLSTTSVGAAAASFGLEILWSAPVTSDQSSPEAVKPATGLMLQAQSALPDGRIISLATRSASGVASQVLFNNLDQDRRDDAVTLNLKGAFPAGKPGFLSRIFSGPQQIPHVSTLAAGLSGEIWVGGSTNGYHDISSAAHSDAYLAKVSPTGEPIWEMAYGNGGWRTIWTIVPLPAGDVVVAGRERWAGRVARIKPDGRQVWERLLGNDLGAAIAPIAGERLAVVGFEAIGSLQAGNYRDHVTVWILDGSGKQLTQTRIRDSINKSEGSHFGKVLLVTSDKAIYVASQWMGLFDAQPVEISKLSDDGKLLWNTPLPDTAISVATRGWKTCSPTLAVTPSGGILVACTLDRQIQLYQLDPSSGAHQKSLLPSPECQAAYANLFLNIRKDGTMMLSGSRPDNSVAPSCTWVGRLTATK